MLIIPPVYFSESGISVAKESAGKFGIPSDGESLQNGAAAHMLLLSPISYFVHGVRGVKRKYILCNYPRFGIIILPQ